MWLRFTVRKPKSTWLSKNYNDLFSFASNAEPIGKNEEKEAENLNFGFEIKQTGQGYHVAKSGFDLMVSREFLQSMDYTEMRRLELVIRDLMKE